MEKQFNQLRQTWDYLGEHDPLWAILSFPQKRGNRWQLEEFFATGQDEIDAVLQAVADRFPDVPRGCALDFGCGVDFGFLCCEGGSMYFIYPPSSP